MWISKMGKDYLINVIDTNLEINDVIKTFFSKFSYLEGKYNFDIYVCENCKVIIVVTLDDISSMRLNCRLIYHFNSIFMYRMDFYNVDNYLMSKGDLFFFRGCFYYYSDRILSDTEYAKLFELSDEFLIGRDAIEIYNNGIKLSHSFLYCD